MLLADPLERGGVNVGDHDRGAVLDQVADQVLADLADAGDADGAARRARCVPHATWAAARMPWKTPYAVSTELSPAPPWATVRPVTNETRGRCGPCPAEKVPTSQAV